MDRFDEVSLVEQLFCHILPGEDELYAIQTVLDVLYSSEKYTKATTFEERLHTIKDLIKRIHGFSGPVASRFNTVRSLFCFNYLAKYREARTQYDKCMAELMQSVYQKNWKNLNRKIGY